MRNKIFVALTGLLYALAVLCWIFLIAVQLENPDRTATRLLFDYWPVYLGSVLITNGLIK